MNNSAETTSVEQTPRVYPQNIDQLRPHVGHKIVCEPNGESFSVRCSDCSPAPHAIFTARAASDYQPLFAQHAGHDLICKNEGREVHIFCATCGVNVIESTPF